MKWTQQRIDALETMWKDGSLSCAKIGSILGVSKNAIIGKASRLKLGPKGEPEDREKIIARLTPRRKKKLTPRIKKTENRPKLAPVIEKPKFNPEAKQVLKSPVTLAEISPRQCRWILDLTKGKTQGGQALICGKEIFKKSYCKDHAERAFQKPRDEKKGYDQ